MGQTKGTEVEIPKRKMGKEWQMKYKNLNDVLQDIDIENQDQFNLHDFLDDVNERYPGWALEAWDCDCCGTSLTADVLDYIKQEIWEGRTEIEYGEWCTGKCDIYIFVVATRKPGGKK